MTFNSLNTRQNPTKSWFIKDLMRICIAAIERQLQIFVEKQQGFHFFIFDPSL